MNARAEGLCCVCAAVNIDWHKTTLRPSASRLRVLAAAAVSVRVVGCTRVVVVLLRVALLATDPSETKGGVRSPRTEDARAGLLCQTARIP